MVTMSDGNTVPVRLPEWYCDMEQDTLLVAVRRFRTRNEVCDVEGGERIERLVRVWEEKGTSSKVILHSTTIQDLCEIYTREEVSRSMHLEDEWEGGVRWADWDAFVGEGFVVKRQKRIRQGDSFRSPPPFVESSAPSAREGTGDEPLFGIRKKGFRYNTKNLVFASIPLCVFNDACNAWSMSIKG
ncbi:unnamed protein product [Ectocarpus sp. CCAP 1310/34]|nr:unnamed protein product [Ectocarpus sp. CCAP 1310/34]